MTRRARKRFTPLIAATVALGVLAGLLTPGPAQAAPAACAINQAMPSGSTAYNSWAAAYKCGKTSSGAGTAVGTAAVWKPGFYTDRYVYDAICNCNVRRNELGSCPDEEHTDLSLTMHSYNQYFQEGKTRLTAFGRYHCFDWPNEATMTEDHLWQNVVYLFWGLQNGGTAMRFFDVAYECDGSYLYDEMDVHANGGAWSVYIKPAATAGRWDIIYGKGTGFACDAKVTNIGGLAGNSAEQYVGNNHRSIPGSTRHRAEASNLQSLESGAWRYWSINTGTNRGGSYSGVTVRNAATYCLRTGNLTPDCP